MSLSERSLIRYSLGVCLFILLCLLCRLPPSWGASTKSPIAKVDVLDSRERYPAGGTYPILFKICVSSPWYLHGPKAGRNGLIPTVLSFSDIPGLRVEGIRFPVPEKKKFAYAKEPIEVLSRKFSVQARLEVDPDVSPGKYEIKGRLSYQPCSSRSCLPPESIPISLTLSVAPAGAHGKLKNQDIFSSGEWGPAYQGPVAGWTLGGSLWLTLLGLFLGGLALNLTPCIYPLIPITVSYFGGRRDKAYGKTIIHGALYISGLAVTNSTLGLSAALSGGLLGSVLQNPVVPIVVSAILVSLGLSFFGLWELHIPAGLTGFASRNFGGYFGTFFMGLTLGIVAAPCLGPFILGLLTYVGQKGEAFLGFLYFFVLSIGLGLPLSILAIFSGALERLPVSGGWMVWIRKLLGWVLMGMAAYLLQPLLPGPVGKNALFAGVFFIAGLHLGWLDRSGGTFRLFQYIKKALGVLLIGGAIIFVLVKPPASETIHWIPYDQAVLTKAEKENKPVILDFYADWCGPCKALDRKVFADPEVVRLSREFITIRVDLTRRHPYQERLRKRYQIRGVPTIIFINRQGMEERPLRVESFVNRDEVLNRMKGLINAYNPPALFDKREHL